jgi:hypothetical protein
MTQSEQELVDALDKTSDMLGMIVFLSIRHHPDQEIACQIADVLTKARGLVAKHKGGGK